MVLGELPVSGRPSNLDNSRARAYCACSGCGWGFVRTFFLSFSISHFFLLRRPDIDRILSQRDVKLKQANQPTSCFIEPKAGIPIGPLVFDTVI